LSLRLVQLRHPQQGRRAALVTNDLLQVLSFPSIFDVAGEAIETRKRVTDLLKGGQQISYDEVYEGRSEWKLLPAFDHPDDPGRCLVSGTGLTHRKSAENRQAMHAGTAAVTDSMRMYQIGEEGGRPEAGQIGTAPEWFYKGNGMILRAHNEALAVPRYAGDGGEEPEVAGAYVIARDGTPVRVGFVQGNEFSDHKTERLNYLYLAPSKLRNCSIGPELVMDADFTSCAGRVAVLRDGNVVWQKAIASGEANMCHSLANLEHHHFKFEQHRRPGDAHVHFFGADAFSFGEGVQLQDGDVMEVSFEGFGRPLRNPVRMERGDQSLVQPRALVSLP
jgi:hypothetical protein